MSITAMLNQTFDIYSGATIDENGQEEYPAIATTAGEKGRIERSSKERRQSDGTVITIDAVVFCGPGVTIARGDKIISDSIDYRVSRVNKMWGISSLSHLELECVEIS